MTALDFPNAQLPQLAPLAQSYAENPVETDLKRLFLDLFNTHLAADTFDVNVLGASHLGSFDLVRRAVNTDGLVLMQGDREEAATRYLYRAWKSGNLQGRGLHFLRTYLQMLFPNLCEVEQLWHDKNLPYPTGLVSAQPRFSWWLHQVGESGLKLDGSWGIGRRIANADPDRANRQIDTNQMYLTSRIEIVLDFSVNVRSIASLMHIIRSVIPARLLPIFRFWLRFVLHVQILASSNLLMQKDARMRYPWCGRVIGESDDVRWKLGRDGEIIRLPQPFGTFKLGEVRGGKSVWHLHGCRIDSDALLQSAASVSAYRLPTLGETWRRLDGSWRLGARSLHIASATRLQKHFDIPVNTALEPTFHEHHTIAYPATPARLGSKVRLAHWRRLDGSWQVGSLLKPRPFGFVLHRDTPILAESALTTHATSQAYAIPERLPLPVVTKLATRPRKLDGAWVVGTKNRLGHFRLDGRPLRAMKLTVCPRLGQFVLMSGAPGAVYATGDQARRLKLNGSWHLGGPAAPEVTIKVFKTS